MKDKWEYKVLKNKAQFDEDSLNTLGKERREIAGVSSTSYGTSKVFMKRRLDK